MKTIRDLRIMEWSGMYYPLTDSIERCSLGSRTWWHEHRHREQYKKVISHSKIAKFSDSIAGFGIFFTAGGLLAYILNPSFAFPFWMIGSLLLFPFASVLAWQEWDAEVFSWKQYFRNVSVQEAIRAKKELDILKKR